jgi:hypothetical protein
MVWFKFGSGEWIDIPIVKTQTKYAHSVTAVDFTLYKGQKCLVIEDSWGKFGQWAGQRLITEDFFKARCFFAAYFINFKYEQDYKPTYNGSITSIQDCLKYEQLFPSNIESTGLWLAITDKAVKDFCVKYQIKFVPSRKMWPELEAKLKQLYP